MAESINKSIDLVNVSKITYPDLFIGEENINLNSNSATKLLSDYTQPKAYDKIGYARPLGGFFYQFFYAIISAGITAATYPFLLGYLYPWPDSQSYANIAGVLFILIQAIFNVPTSYALEMFVGEYRIKNPMKMMEYIRFYIWYQMLTGVFLVTGFSFYILYAFNTGDLLFLKYIMLIIIAKEWPAMTGIFITMIRALQQFHIESGLNFMIDTIFSNIFKILCVIWGKNILGANPAIGPLLGIAIGISVGSYVSEIASMILCSFYMNKILKPWGYTLKDMFIPHFGWDVIKRCLKFGFITSIPGLIGSSLTTITTLWWYNSVPAFLTFMALSGLADSLANIIKAGGGINIYATLSEAINNRKKELASYYISMIWKFVFFFKFAIGAILVSFIPIILEIFLVVGGAENYILAIGFIIPNIIATMIEQPQSSGDVVILSANKPTFKITLQILCDLLGMGMTFLYLIVLQLPQRYGINAILWIMPLGNFPIGVFKLTMQWRYINKNIAPVRVKQFAWQTFIAPIVPSIIIGLVALGWKQYVFYQMIELLGGDTMGMLITGVISILFAFVVCTMGIFFPLYCFFGGYDINTLAIFDEAVRISGPSRFLFNPINKASHLFEKISPLHNRFPIQWKDAMQEADDLMKERHIKDKLTKEFQIN